MARTRFSISSAIRIETASGALANPRWMALLASLGSSRSITAAARSAGLSYKAAWDAIDAMNNLAGRPVVETSIGGKDGGGAKLSAHGHRLLETYQAVAAENERFLADLNSKLRRSGRVLRMLGRFSMRTSARNQWSGRIAKIRRGAVNDEIVVKLAGRDRVVAVITHESAETLDLEVGGDVIALVKASSIVVGTGRSATLALSARNQLAGEITRIVPGAVNSEVVIALRGGQTVAAIITNVAARDLKLKAGQQARAIFKASSVILGVT